jgi:hypothetical protein
VPAQLAACRALAVAVGVALSTLVICTELNGFAKAQSFTALKPWFSPDRLHAKGALTISIHFAGGEFGVPSPVRRSVVKFPAGLSLDIPTLRSCSAARLRARGAGGCPPQSKLGGGHALLEGHAGSQLITESITLGIFLGPLQNFQPTFELLGEGYTPLHERVVLGGTVIPARAPYGEELVIDIPPIHTLPLEPDASIATLTLTVGTSSHRPAHDANTVVVPGSCPAGGFPFAAEFTYADASSGSALATVLCPR